MAAAGVRPDHHIIEGTFEIDHSPWIFFCGLKRNLTIRIYSSEKKDLSSGKGLESDAGYPSVWKLAEREKVPVVLGIGKINLPNKITKFKLKFKVVKEFGSPGAIVVENNGKKEFLLKSATLRYIVPDQEEKFHFHCNSWVYPLDKTKIKRVFFINRLYLPRETPPGLVEFRKKELEKLRKRGSQGERKAWDRIYEYDLYNDLGDPDNGREYSRPVLGGSGRFPYPRRLRTGRPPCQQEHSAESRPAGCFQVYVPPDERLSHAKQEELINNFVDALLRFLTPKSDESLPSFDANPGSVKKIVHTLLPKAAFSSANKFRMMFQSIVDFFTRKPNSASDQDSGNLDSIDDILKFYSEKEVKEFEEWERKKLENLIPDDIFKKVTTTATKRKPENSQLPSIIAEEKDAWSADEEFGREMLAGTNPVRIRLLQESDITSGTKWLDDHFEARIRKKQNKKKAFILEHKKYLLPYLDAINGKGVCAYATRTILVRSGWYNTIKPIVIELCLPDSKHNKVICPEDGYRWLLAKAHVAANDAAHHQLVSHWLHTHAVIEPFIIATRRQLSVMHPIHRLLDPHFKDTLHINALARAIFLNAGGILERTLFTGEYSMSLSSEFYKEWRFDKQALPLELENRNMSVKDMVRGELEIEDRPVEEDEVPEERVEDLVERDKGPGEIDENAVEVDDHVPAKDDKTPDKQEKIPAGVKLILEDYPYATDGLEIWYAIETWVRDYCEIFYTSDDSVNGDDEIQTWWQEIKNNGHRDKKGEGWYQLTTRESLVRALTTLIWITSGLHAAVNFGQYAYAGWPPNRPMLLRKFIPEQNSDEHSQLKEDPDQKFLDKFLTQMWPEKFDMAYVIALMDLLSRHTSDDVYLGQRPQENESDENGKKVNEKCEMFRWKLRKIEKNIKERNKRYDLMNRWGVAKIPYKLLYPDTDKTKPPPSEEKDRPQREDITGRGIPNNISI